MPPTAQHMARKRQRGLTEPGGVTHFSLMSPLTLVVLQVSDRLSFQVRITRFGSCILITGGATGTERKFKKKKQVWLNFQPAHASGSSNAHTHIMYWHHFTWSYCQVVVMWSDILFPESACAHIAAFVGLLCVVDDDALLQAWRKLETRGQSSTGACFQAQVVQTWISCQAGDGSIVSLASENAEHHWFSERIVGVCQEKCNHTSKCHKLGCTLSCWSFNLWQPWCNNALYTLFHHWQCDGWWC